MTEIGLGKKTFARPAKWIALAVLVALAAGLRFANLDALGDANHYYTAAVKAMSQSWQNFFFAAAEPGGSVSVDKPPVGLWFQVASAAVFGVNGFGVVLPQILAGIFSVLVLYRLVRQAFGALAGWLAGLALAITPVVVATDRNNTMDSTLILTLLLAAWAFSAATTRGKLRYLILGSFLVGVGFNIKMLQAYLPVPAFLVFYFLGSPERWGRKLANLTLAAIVLVGVSLSWALLVDLTPAEQRPYVGSSSDNSELSLIAGYNGAQRLLGMGGRGNGLLALFTGGANAGARAGGFQPPQGAQPPQGFQPPQNQFRDDRPQPPQGLNTPQDQNPMRPDGAPGGGAPGGFNIGQPGAWRLFTAPLSKEAGWLLPTALLSALLLTVSTRPRLPLAPKHCAVVLWGGWLLTAGIFFSVAGFFHEYYLSMLAPAIAALVGIGIAEVWRLRAQHSWVALLAVGLASVATLAVQIPTANAYVRDAWWLPVVVAASVAGGVLWLPWLSRRFAFAAPLGLLCLVLAWLLTPGIWSALTTLYSSANQSLPSAYDGRASGPPNRGGTQIDQTLLAYLQANTQGVKYLMAVPSSMQGSDYVLATGRPVLYLGGFNGQDKVATPAQLAQMVADNELRFIYADARGGGGGPGGNQSEISTWVASACTPVGFDAAAQNFGAPDGTPGGAAPNRAGGFGGMQVSLYDCQTPKRSQ